VGVGGGFEAVCPDAEESCMYSSSIYILCIENNMLIGYQIELTLE
jgi:hypothetical protein